MITIIHREVKLEEMFLLFVFFKKDRRKPSAEALSVHFYITTVKSSSCIQ